MKNRICSVEGCDGKHYGNGYCQKHYLQIRRCGKILERTIHDSNEIVLYDDYAEIVMYNMKCEEIARTMIDLDDIEKCKEYKWHFYNQYAYTNIYEDGKNTIKKIHQIILGSWYDHISRDKLDNRKSNLRPCTQQQNNQNILTNNNKSCGIKGVTWNKRKSKWMVRLICNKQEYFLGYFDNLEDAIKVRLQAEKEHYGEFAPQQHLYEQYGIN